MGSIIKESFSLSLKMMRVTGLYPPENPTRLYKVRSYLMFILFIIVTPFLVFLNFKFEETIDMMQKNINAAYLAEVSGFVAKLFPFITRGKQKNIIDKVIRNCRRNSIVFFIGIFGALTCCIIRPLFLEDSTFPIDIWVPFNQTEQKTYYSVYLFIAIAISYDTFTVMVDPLLGGLVYHAAAQIQVLKNNLQCLSKDAEEEIRENPIDNPSERHAVKSKIVYRKIKECIEHYDAITSFVKEYQDCFSGTLFSQLASSVFVICFFCQCLGMIHGFNYYVFQYLVFMNVILGEIHFYCYYGSILSDESDNLTTAIYMCNWYEFDIKSKKALILFMEGSQRPLIVTVGKLFPLSLETFTMILRRSYSLLAVLKKF